MTFGVNNIINCVNTSSSRTDLSTTEVLQLSGSGCQFQTSPVFSVANIAALPLAADNQGRFVFVQDICAYRFSDGTNWTNDFDSTPVNFEVWSWGENSTGQLGTNNTTSASSPVSVVGGFTDWIQVSAGADHAVGIRQNGTAWSWGFNGEGRLGDNTLTDRSSPVSVVGGFTDWRQVSTGSNHSLAVRQNGTAWAWGNNGQGRLGDNSTVSKLSPVSVVGGFTNWCQVSAGSSHSIGLRQDGTIWAWGCNSQGQLGTNNTTSALSPVAVVGGFTDWCQVSAMSISSHAVRQDGTLWGWGNNNQGRLGDNSTAAKSSPVSVVGGFTDWCQVSSNISTLAVRQNGTIWAWGGNALGQLGTNNTTSRSSPVSVVGGFTNWCQISAGSGHSIGLRQNGIAWAWGSNCCGRLGDNTTINRSSPVSLTNGLPVWCQVSAGDSFSVAIRSGKGFFE